jgi:hypothetical protein
MKKLLSAAVAALLLAAVASLPALAAPLEIAVRVVPLQPENPERLRVGPLAYRGGLELSSEDSRFGGLSGLSVSQDGSRLTAVTDRDRKSTRLNSSH